MAYYAHESDDYDDDSNDYTCHHCEFNCSLLHGKCVDLSENYNSIGKQGPENSSAIGICFL
jgi:hypothetical protein